MILKRKIVAVLILGNAGHKKNAQLARLIVNNS
jgi:hypothetical protein